MSISDTGFPLQDEASAHFHAAARRVADAQIERLIAAYEAGTGRPVSEALRGTFHTIVWHIDGADVQVLINEFTRINTTEVSA